MKCNYCGNTATRKNYRTFDGQTGSTRECEDCAPLTNEAVLDREAKYRKANEALRDTDIENIIDEAMGEFWDIVNEKVGDDGQELLEEFKLDNGMELYDDDLDSWKEAMYEKIQETLKKQL